MGLSEKDSSQNAIVKKFPIKVPVYYALINSFPIFMNWIFISYLKIVDLKDSLRAFMTPIAIIPAIIFAFYFIMLYRVQVKKIYAYDGSEESIEKVNKAIKTLELFAMLSVLVNAAIVNIVAQISCKRLGVVLDVLPLWVSSFGSFIIYSLFFYICFIQKFEGCLGDIVFRKEHKSMSIAMRNMCVSFLNVIGAILYCVTPTLVLRLVVYTKSQLFFRYQLPVCIFAIVTTIASTYRLMRGTSRRIKAISDFTDNIADKDYTGDKISVQSRDEFGLLINNLNSFYEGTKALLKDILGSVDSSTQTATVFSEQMTESSAAMEEIVANIKSVKERIINQAASVTESQSTIKEMVKSIDDLNQNVGVQFQGIETSSSAIEQMVSNIKSVTSILEKNSMSVSELGHEAENGNDKINHSTELSSRILEKSAGLLEASSIIQNIAEQTNLLAMNAAIEAAHAGEAGRGFAVVADEIRKLAEQSNSQGETITAQLKELQDAINSVADNTSEVQRQFEVIFKLTNIVSEQETVIKTAMEEQSVGSTQILNSINDIKDFSQKVKDSSDMLLEGGKQIDQEMDILSDATVEISNSMNEMVIGAEQVSKSVEVCNESSAENTDNINNLEATVNQFTI